MKHSNKFLPTIWWKYHTKTCKVSFSTGMFVSMYSHNELLTKFFVFYAKLMKLSRKWLILTPRGGVEDTRLEAKANDTKKPEAKAKAKDSLSEDRHSRGQGEECSRPRPRTKDTSASALQKKKEVFTKSFSGDFQKKKKKKVFTKIFQAISTKKRFLKNLSSAPQNFNNSKNTAVLERKTGWFSRTWGLEAKDLTFEAKAKTKASKCVLEDVFEAKDVLEDSTSANSPIWCQLITKTNWKCNAVSFGPVCQLWFATFKGKSDSKPQSCIQQHKPSKVTRNATNKNKHTNKASKQTFANNLFQISNKYTHGMLSHWKICFNVFNLGK